MEPVEFAVVFKVIFDKKSEENQMENSKSNG